MKVSASILSADLGKLKEELALLESAGVDYIHLDIMDGHFVTNLTFGPCLVSAVRKYTRLHLDVHLMIQPVQHIDAFCDAGADFITIHSEADLHLVRTLQYIKSKGLKAGVSLVPSTTHRVLEYLMSYIDIILIMSVNPGFGGQKFLDPQLEKVRKVKEMMQGEDILLSVDGGVNGENAMQLKSEGVDVVVAGSYIFNHRGGYTTAVKALKG